MKKNKTPSSRIAAVREWEKDNIYKMTITFYKNDFPKEKFEEAKRIIKERGESYNKFFTDKMKELLNEKRR